MKKYQDAPSPSWVRPVEWLPKMESPYIEFNPTSKFSDSSFHFQLLSILGLPPFDFGLAAAWPCSFLGAICRLMTNPNTPQTHTKSHTKWRRGVDFADPAGRSCWCPNISSRDVETKAMEAILVGGFNPFWKIWVKMGILPKQGWKSQKYLSCHQPAIVNHHS